MPLLADSTSSEATIDQEAGSLTSLEPEPPVRKNSRIHVQPWFFPEVSPSVNMKPQDHFTFEEPDLTVNATGAVGLSFGTSHHSPSFVVCSSTTSSISSISSVEEPTSRRSEGDLPLRYRSLSSGSSTDHYIPDSEEEDVFEDIALTPMIQPSRDRFWNWPQALILTKGTPPHPQAHSNCDPTSETESSEGRESSPDDQNYASTLNALASIVDPEAAAKAEARRRKPVRPPAPKKEGQPARPPALPAVEVPDLEKEMAAAEASMSRVSL